MVITGAVFHRFRGYTSSYTRLSRQPMKADKASVTSAYRRLLRTALQAVRFSTPARYQVNGILRDSFRNAPPAAFVPRRIEKTIGFLEQAREHAGLEHKILRNIIHVRWWRDNRDRNKPTGAMKENTDVGVDLRQNVGGQFDATLTVFNETMDLCLRV